MFKNFSRVFIFTGMICLFLAGSAYARTDISLTSADVSFSRDNALAGETIKIYARANNLGDSDVYGSVVFMDNGKDVLAPQVISAKAGSYDDVFVDWKVTAGQHKISVKIQNLSLQDDNLENNRTVEKDYFADIDTDKDGIPDKKDPDSDNDGVPNVEENANGTDPLAADTDSDGVSDKIDAFPLDKSEWRDTNRNGIGDNKDPDADGDTITNVEEIQKYGTNPMNSDTDSDQITDNVEINEGTDPLKSDTDGDGVNDSQDKFPLDPKKTGASMMDSIAGVMNSPSSFYVMLGIPAALIMVFLFWKRKPKRR